MKRLLSRPMRSSRRPSPRGFATIELPIVLLLFSLGVFYFAATLRFVTRVLEPTGGMAVLGVLGALATAGFLFYMTVYFSLHIAERLSHRLGGECFLLPFVAPLAVPLFLNAATRALRDAPLADLSDGQKVSVFLASALAGFLLCAAATTLFHLLWRGLVYVLVAIRNSTDTPFTRLGE